MFIETLHGSLRQYTPTQPVISLFFFPFFLYWMVNKIFRHHVDYPKAVLDTGLPTVLGSWLSSIHYLFCGPEILQYSYEKAAQKPFTIATPENYHVVLSSPKDVAELLAAPQEKLSFHAIITDLFRPKHTMGGMELHDDPDKNEPNIHMRVLRVLLPSFAPTLRVNLENAVSEQMEKELNLALMHLDEWRAIQMYPMIQRLVTKLNGIVFFGEPLASNLEFLQAAQQYPMDVFIASEVIRMIPSFLSRPIAMLMTRRNHNLKIIQRHLSQLVKERIERNSDREQCQKPLDCVQWLIDSLPKEDPWSVDKIVSKICALWFGSIHILAMTLTYALYDLCTYQSYIDPLREEVLAFREGSEGESLTDQYRNLTKLPLLDSFLKESARLHPATTIGVRRKAVTSYTFTDGTHVPAGNWVCVPQQAIQRDPQYYPDPNVFEGSRFVSPDIAKDSKGCGKRRALTDIEFSMPIWGMGKRACPGRYHASLVMKLVIAHVLINYDVRFANERAPRSITWGSVIVPRESNKVLFKRKDALEQSHMLQE